jgi:hypothetical protein
MILIDDEPYIREPALEASRLSGCWRGTDEALVTLGAGDPRSFLICPANSGGRSGLTCWRFDNFGGRRPS